jgi:hypothetical protein
MVPAARAKLLDGEFLGLALFVPAGGIIASFASVACHAN